MTGVIFDLDGTLLDTLEDLKDAVNATLTKFGYPLRSLEEVRRFVGNGAKVLIQLAVPENTNPEPVYAAFREYYQKNCQVKTAPYPGIAEVLATLDVPVAIVSNKPDSAVKSLCAQYFPGIYALGESAECPRKPAPDMVFKAMRDIGVGNCIYVGDSEVDVATARNVGIPCLSVTWGFRNQDELLEAGATHFCHDPKDIPQLIQAMT